MEVATGAATSVDSACRGATFMSEHLRIRGGTLLCYILGVGSKSLCGMYGHACDGWSGMHHVDWCIGYRRQTSGRTYRASPNRATCGARALAHRILIATHWANASIDTQQILAPVTALFRPCYTILNDVCTHRYNS